MRNVLLVQPRPVTLLKGGGPIQRDGQDIGKTEKGQVWQSHSVWWGTGPKAMLWMLDPADENVGAWANLQDTEGGGAEGSLSWPVGV